MCWCVLALFGLSNLCFLNRTGFVLLLEVSQLAGLVALVVSGVRGHGPLGGGAVAVMVVVVFMVVPSVAYWCCLVVSCLVASLVVARFGWPPSVLITTLYACE